MPLTTDLLFESSPDCAKVLDLQGNLVSMNRNGQCLMEVDDLSQMCGLAWTTLWPGESRQQIESALEQARQGDLGQFTAFCPTSKGVPKFWDVCVSPIHGTDRQLQGFLAVSRDVTELQELLRAREQAVILADAQKLAMEQAVSGASLEQVLGTVVRAAEAHSQEAMLVSVLLAHDGHLRHGAAPSLPQAYSAAIDGMATGPNAGSCGTAAHFNQEVIVSDIATDPLWQDYKELALSHGLRS
ncbi:PAS domain-containing protein [Gemmatimonas groenlandica]|uniref:PAS domain-containing protein n=1 Tax=Gemmatimonas groenlandica TaxID=2732249 RepID=A0A6M4ISZ5_9BACT|nr:PAS domain-containing protein [Gemmatimonas groenlandica]QJR37894.1 PAS domain-containing protein [Gemmatimonas groenlandica]